jgi:hypothetical protein
VLDVKALQVDELAAIPPRQFLGVLQLICHGNVAVPAIYE